jgi:hypothetical protein
MRVLWDVTNRGGRQETLKSRFADDLRLLNAYASYYATLISIATAAETVVAKRCARLGKGAANGHLTS